LKFKRINPKTQKLYFARYKFNFLIFYFRKFCF
jgi:hypothetical protein